MILKFVIISIFALLSALPLSAMQESDDGQSAYTVRIAMLVKEVVKELGYPEDIANYINKRGIESSYFSFTFPTVEELNNASKLLRINVYGEPVYKLDENILNEGRKVKFKVTSNGSHCFEFIGLCISTHTIDAYYKAISSGFHQKWGINGQSIPCMSLMVVDESNMENCKVTVADEQFRNDNAPFGNPYFASLNMQKSYTSASPKDIRIIRKLG